MSCDPEVVVTKLSMRSEKAIHVLCSQFMQGFKSHCFSFLIYMFLNGLPSEPLNSRSAKGIKGAIFYYPSSTIWKFLQLCNFYGTTAAPKQSSSIKCKLHCRARRDVLMLPAMESFVKLCGSD